MQPLISTGQIRPLTFDVSVKCSKTPALYMEKLSAIINAIRGNPETNLHMLAWWRPTKFGLHVVVSARKEGELAIKGTPENPKARAENIEMPCQRCGAFIAFLVFAGATGFDVRPVIHVICDPCDL